MDVAEITDACRLCPTGGTNQQLINVFDERVSEKNNMREVILVTTGVEILENDFISKKICQRCLNITLKVFQFRQDAQKQDRHLKAQLNDIVKVQLSKTIPAKEEMPIILPQIEIKIEPNTEPKTNKKTLHPSVTEIYKNNPCLKIPKLCVENNLAPDVIMVKDQVERYFRKRKLNMSDFIAKGRMTSKKRFSSPIVQQAEQKMVSPLRISKKQCEESNADSYFCVNNKQGVIPKDVIIPSLNEPSSSSTQHKQLPSSSTSKIVKANKDELLLPHTNSSSSTKTIKANKDKLLPPHKQHTSSSSNKIIKANKDVSIPPPAPKLPDPSVCRKLTTPPPPMVEDAAPAVASAAGPSVEFFQNFGLTPTVTTTKTHPLLSCTYCGSMHYHSLDLKRHTIKVHTMCQFCKKRFKTVEGKQKHQEKGCEVQAILNNPPIVSLEKIELNLDIRKKFKKTFSGFGALAGLDDDVIILSDDDETVVAPEQTERDSPPVLEPFYTTVSIVKPSIRIKNDKTIDEIEPGLDNSQLKQLISTRTPRKLSVDTAIQTDFPSSILINNIEGTCQFSGLKEFLLNYKVAVEVQNGDFHANYKFDEKPPQRKPVPILAKWDHLPVIDVQGTSAQSSNSIRTNARVLASQRVFASTSSITPPPKTPPAAPPTTSPAPPTKTTSAPPTKATSAAPKKTTSAAPKKTTSAPVRKISPAPSPKTTPVPLRKTLSAPPPKPPVTVTNYFTITTSSSAPIPLPPPSYLASISSSSPSIPPLVVASTSTVTAPSSSSAPILLNGFVTPPIPAATHNLTFRLTAPSTTSPAVVNSATPLLQTYALSQAPSPMVNATPIPFPKRFVNKTKTSTIPRLILGSSLPSVSPPNLPSISPPNLPAISSSSVISFVASNPTITGVYPPNNNVNPNGIGATTSRNPTPPSIYPSINNGIGGTTSRNPTPPSIYPNMYPPNSNGIVATTSRNPTPPGLYPGAGIYLPNNNNNGLGGTTSRNPTPPASTSASASGSVFRVKNLSELQ